MSIILYQIAYRKHFELKIAPIFLIDQILNMRINFNIKAKKNEYYTPFSLILIWWVSFKIL